MALPFFNWSRTAANNATADSTVNWQEGQAPSTVNDSARAMMASTAAFRDDIAGAITTGGTSTAYTLTSFQVFDTLVHLNGQVIAFVPHTTSGATVTLNVDGLGAKPLRFAPSVELLAGTLIQGTPYIATYNNSDAVFYLRNFFGNNPYYVPIGGVIDYFGSSAPNSNFVLPFGQAISRTTYATLFSLFSTTFGVGDGSTTFNVPDLRGRIVVGQDNMGGSAANRITNAGSSIVGTTLGATGGGETQTLTLAQLPTGITVTGTVTVTSTQTFLHGGGVVSTTTGTAGVNFDAVSPGTGSLPAVSSNGSNTLTSNNTSGNAHPIVQPSIIGTKLLRVI